MEIRQVTVLGAGTMGHGIAQAAAQAGFEVCLVDTSEAVLKRAFHEIRRNLDEGVARGKVPESDRADALARLRGRGDVETSGRTSDLIIEAVPERLELKVQVLRSIEAVAPAHAILASNTSSLSITTLQRALTRPGRALGLHFFNPAHIMRLVEVVRGEDTEAVVLEDALEFVRRLGKEPIVVRDPPGFASSRLGLALGLEAMRMLEEGVASAADIDRAMELGYRHPMGPLRLTDLVGLDVRLHIAEYLHASLEGAAAERFRPPEILRRLVAEGKLGKKTGEGFYHWEE